MIQTEYDGPETTTTLQFGEATVKVVRPTDPDRLLDDEGVRSWNRADDYMPYWAYLWPGAFLLAEAVAREPGLNGKTALEMGCGLGLAGLVGLARGMTVDFTDYDDAPLRFVSRSVQASGFPPERFSTRILDWRRPEARRYPVILGADVLYEKRLVPLVADVIAAMLEPGGVALVAGPYRVATEDLGACLASRGLDAQSEPIRSRTAEGADVRGTLHRIRRKSDVHSSEVPS